MDNSKLEQLKEYARIIKDTPYALKTYLQTWDNTQRKFVPLDLFPDQIELIHDYETYNDNITKKYRQAGVSTVTAAWVSKILQTSKPEKPEKILIVANKRETAVEMANKIRGFLDQWPKWMSVGYSPNKNSESRYVLSNGCEVKAVATSKDALRGYTPTILIFDEAAYIEAGEDFWAASMASLSTGGKIILISTPNGFDKIYYPIYSEASLGRNEFKITDLRWYKDPRYNKDLSWVKVEDIVHYMLNRQDYNDNEVISDYHGYEDYEVMLSEGYKPYSSWYEMMAKKLKYDYRKMNQEINGDFLGSGDSVIPPAIQEKIRKNMIIQPTEKFMSGSLWQWKEPIKGHRYIMGCDVSRGDSEDYSSINIIDFDDREQVLEYVGKLPPDDLASISYKWGLYYNAFIVVDITGGMGVATSRKLQELGYKDMFIDGINVKNIWEYNSKLNDKIPGINFNNKRTQIVASFEEQLRNGFLIHSQRLMNEIGTFIYTNGRPDHIKGAHDDLIMSIAMALYAGDISFSSLKKNDDINKSMLESWVVSEKSYDPNELYYSYGRDMDSVGRMFTENNPAMPNSDNKKIYSEYSWLFGIKK